MRLFDIGRSYERLCALFGGQNITFRIDDPKSLNPLWGVVTMQDLTEAMPLLKTLIRQMAYPLTPEEDTPAYEYSLIEQACT
ncbi:hypothetical protein, partial [Vibrio vulnificus]|uniref:TraG/VirB4 family ATPase n=1 Tax=Vibrio vulnificus TaxID=672 RepID=UPI0039B37721